MKKIKETDIAISGINVVPIIDVTLVLLVVLFILTPTLSMDNFPIDLPDAMTKETKDQNIAISMGSDGRVSIDSKIVDWDRIPYAIKSSLNGRKDIVLVVRADRDLPYGSVESLIKLVNKHAGDNSVAIATKQRTTALEGQKQP